MNNYDYMMSKPQPQPKLMSPRVAVAWWLTAITGAALIFSGLVYGGDAAPRVCVSPYPAGIHIGDGE